MVRIIVVELSTLWRYMFHPMCATNWESTRVECTFKRSFIIEYVIDSFLTEEKIFPYDIWNWWFFDFKMQSWEIVNSWICDSVKLVVVPPYLCYKMFIYIFRHRLYRFNLLSEKCRAKLQWFPPVFSYAMQKSNQFYIKCLRLKSFIWNCISMEKWHRSGHFIANHRLHGEHTENCLKINAYIVSVEKYSQRIEWFCQLH